MRTFLRRLARCRAGATAIEYGLIAALVSVVTIVALTAIGTNLNTTYGTVAADLAAG